MVGIRRGWGGLLNTNPDDPESVAEHLVALDAAAVRTIDRSGGTVLHTSRTNPGRVRCHVGPRLPGRTRPCGEPPFDFTPHALRVLDSQGIGVRHRHRRRRHPLLRPAPARRGRQGDRHPQDHGQRRPRHRLLHRVLHRGHPQRAVRPQPAHRRRLPRAHRRRGVVRPLQRRDLPGHQLPGQRRPSGHLRGARRHQPPRRPADGRQERQPEQLRHAGHLRRRRARRRRDGAVGRGRRLRPPQTRRRRRPGRGDDQEPSPGRASSTSRSPT